MEREPFKNTVLGIVFLGVISSLIAAIIWRVSTSAATMPKDPAGRTSALPPNYQRRFCANRKTITYGDKNPEKIVLPLHDGCYGDRVILPGAWQVFEPSLSSSPGDYASVWCDEEPNPRAIVQYTGHMSGSMNDCPAGRPTAMFSAEGRGVLTLVRTKTNTQTKAPIQEDLPEQSYKIDPISPKSGGDPEYSFVIEECHRSGDTIRCSGKVTNKTDAPAHTYLRDSSAVDDEGNSFFIGSFGGGISFASEPSFGGADLRLMPGVPTKFYVTINDAHRNVKTINLQISTDFTGSARYATLIFEGVSVHQY